MIETALLGEFVAQYPAQPATAFWRAVEIGAIARHGLPEGLGLDFGCGDGILTDILLRHVGTRSLIGVDIDPLEIEAARSLPFYVRLHACPGQAVPEPDASIDFVLSNSVLEHVDDLDGALAEIARMLKRDGRFLFTVPAPAFKTLLAGPALPWVAREQYLATLDRRLAHRHYLAPKDWTERGARAGLVVEACRGYLSKAQVQRWETLSRVTGGLLYSVFGERDRPIEIQRTLGLRDPARKRRWPLAFASAIGRVIQAGAGVTPPASTWLDPEEAGCLLVYGRRG